MPIQRIGAWVHFLCTQNLKSSFHYFAFSTLTQQLVKVIYLTPERKLKRKIKEAIIAYRLDKELSKEKILELYLNQVNFGRGAYGIQAAAINYFGKNVKDMTPEEKRETSIKLNNQILFPMGYRLKDNKPDNRT